jgi:hypothetical protein
MRLHSLSLSRQMVHQKVIFEMPIQQLRTTTSRRLTFIVMASHAIVTLKISWTYVTAATASYCSVYLLTLHKNEVPPSLHDILTELVPEHE